MTGDYGADSADQPPMLVERHAAWRTGQPGERRKSIWGDWRPIGPAESHRHWIISRGIFEPIDVREGQVGKIDADQWPRRPVPNTRRKMLAHDESGRARTERVLVAAQK